MAEVMADPKLCTRCKERKPRAEFGRIKALPSAVRAKCRTCEAALAALYYDADKARARAATRRSRLKREYGMTPEQFDSLLASQGGCCAICRSPSPGGKGRDERRFRVDHDHDSGRVRGLLCNMCNVGLGHFGDDIERLAAAIGYLSSRGSG